MTAVDYRGPRALAHRISTRLYGPRGGLAGFAWVPGERMAIGAIPVGAHVAALPEHGFTHAVVCRAGAQTVVSQDLWAARAVLGHDNVAHAPMWDHGKHQPAPLWAPAARFAAETLRENPDARVLIHCQQGRRRSVMVAYAALRLLGHDPEEAARLVLETRPMGRLMPAYRESVERWLDENRAGDPPAEPPALK